MKTLIGVLLAAILVALGIASPVMAAPQGPWILPASDISTPGRNAQFPQITTAPDGTTTAVWSSENNNNLTSVIQAATRPPGGSFGTPVDLSAPGLLPPGLLRWEVPSQPQITTAPDGTTTAVWGRYDGSNFIIQAATRPPGGAFGTRVDLSVAAQRAGSAQITTAPDGTATAVWHRYDGSYWIVQAATRPPGGSFGAPVDLSAPGETAYYPQITTAPDGTATAIWSDLTAVGPGSSFIVQAATRPPGGSFGAPVDLSAPGQDASSPQITTAPDGTTTAVWWGSGGIQAATRPPGGSFGAPVDLGGGIYPQITTAPDGTATAVWNSAGFIRAATRPPGGSFGAPVVLGGGRSDSSPQITTAPDGTTTAVWEWRRYSGANFVIQAATRPPSGTFGAPVDLSAPGQGAVLPQIATSPDGVATAVWQRSDGANSIIQSASTAGPSPRLRLQVTPKSKKVKRGTKVTFKVKVKNTGNAAAKKLKVCAKGPKKLVKVPKCRKPGKLVPGKAKTVKFKVKVKNRAKKGKKAKITFTAYAKGATKKSGKATVKIR